jgi:hypothetical protein
VNNKLPLRNNITRDFVLKTCLVICGFEVEYRVGSFTRKRLAKIKREWPQIQNAILRTVQMVNTFGIRRDNLTSLNALIPVIYFLYHHPDIDPTSPNSRLVPKNTRAVRAWLLTALLSRAFSGSSDVAIQAAREALKDNKDEVFPAAAVNRELRSVGKDVAITDLDRFSYGRRETYLALSLLYPEEYWRLGKQDIDHIFARSRVNEKALREAGIKEATRRTLVHQRDRIGNLMFLPGDDNRKEKRAKPIKVWIKMRDPRKFMRDGLIPRGADLLELSRFDTFVRKRETKILKRLRTLVPIGRRKARR